MRRVLALVTGWLSSLTVGQLPVNRLFTVDAGQPTPDLKCIVGFHSIEAEVTWRMNCSEAHTKEMVLAKDFRKALDWPPGQRILKFGSQSNGKPWPGNVTSWVCATIPRAGTVTFDCVPENQAPSWYKTHLAGPAAAYRGRRVGCNGWVCYCNHEEYCNATPDVHPEPLIAAASSFSAFAGVVMAIVLNNALC